MKTKLRKTKKSQNNDWLQGPVFRLISYAFLAVVAVTIVTLLSYQFAYYHKIYPGIKVGDINIGNKTPTEARQILESNLTQVKKNGVAFSFNNEVKNYSLEDLQISYDLDQVVKGAYYIGRGPNILGNLVEKFRAWFAYYNLSPKFSFSNQKVDEALNYFGKKVDKKAQEVAISYQNGQVNLTPPQDGKVLDTQKAREDLNSNLTAFSVSPILLNQKTIQASISKEEAEKYRTNLQTLLQTPLKLTFKTKEWKLGGDKLASLISFTNDSSNQLLNVELQGNPLTIEKVTIARAINQKPISLSLSQENLRSFVQSIAAEVDQEPVDAKFNFENGKVSQFSPSQEGQKLNQEDTIDKINQLFADLQKEPTKEVSIALQVGVEPPKVTTDSVNNLGIKELIGVGNSTFFHSIPNRAANIQLAASRVNGTLVAPGETFSMYKTIGEVDGSTGYKEAYIISKGKTQLDFGGGVCQVSTTLFRAALNSGLPILERHAHAYRVGYYEQNSAPGIDASVFFPYSDFRFKNDTEHYILIQTKFNLASASLSFEFYGTKDGRSVSMTKPSLYNQIPPPPDVHQDDPTLPVGTVKQVDFSAWGATTSFNRTVIKDGAVLYKDTFTSVYQPWQAVFLHGTKVG